MPEHGTFPYYINPIYSVKKRVSPSPNLSWDIKYN